MNVQKSKDEINRKYTYNKTLHKRHCALMPTTTSEWQSYGCGEQQIYYTKGIADLMTQIPFRKMIDVVALLASIEGGDTQLLSISFSTLPTGSMQMHMLDEADPEKILYEMAFGEEAFSVEIEGGLKLSLAFYPIKRKYVLMFPEEWSDDIFPETPLKKGDR